MTSPDFYNMKGIVWIGLLIAFLVSCKTESAKKTLFTDVGSDHTGISFANNLTFDQNFNVYTYRNFYNGGGVGLGDLNKDGLIDIYLTANQGSNKLYLNKGNFVFEDITEKAGVGGTKAWSTGVSMADINGDGWLDIYVCNSGDVKGDNKENELFINNGDLTFSEKAKEYGVADRGFTTHAAFLDYDKDGDLDLYILNNSYQAIGSFNLRKNERPKRDSLGGDKLLRNDNGKFTDVSEAAGIYGSVIGFGLGVTVGDINKDGWSDLYISNDFFERDYLYINNQNGTFKEVLTEQMKSISGASMGADMADINNDGYADIFVTEMLPADNARLKTVTTFENWDRYQYNVSNGYYHQFTRNILQLNNGNGSFSEIGRLCGVEATDWSWGALMFDMDNDGLKDIFVANGIYQDLTNQDYLQYVSNEEVVRSIITDKDVDYKKLVELIPSTPISNFAFHNQGNFKFKNKATEWGLGVPGFSNGSAYGDLDNDGDLDLVVNNVNNKASIFRNETNVIHPDNHYLKFDFEGATSNFYALGTSVTLTQGDKIFYQEQMPNRGFQSSMDPRPNIGLGSIDTVEVVTIRWPDGKETILKNVPTNQVLKLKQSDGIDGIDGIVTTKQDANPVFKASDISSLNYFHIESEFVDFDRDKLVFHMLSTEGPRIAKADVNGDGKDDIYIGGSKGISGALLVQLRNGEFKRQAQPAFDADKESEDTQSTFFDADNDGDADLYVCSGSNEFSTSSIALADRLYLNDGKGNFTKSAQILPTVNFENSSVVKPIDFDNDGDIDLFVGIRSHPFLYGMPTNGYILSNDGKGFFTNVTSVIAPSLIEIGMITDAVWADINGDSQIDLIVVGEYMPVTILIQENGKLVDKTDATKLANSNGWWNTIDAADLDHDGDIDFVIGNHGLNSRFKASLDRPVSMYINDFDNNGTVEQIISSFNGDKSYPLALRHDLISQIPSLKKKYLKYESLKDQTITDIFSATELEKSVKLEAYELSSSLLINDGNGGLSLKHLPVTAQMSVVYAVTIDDFDHDGNMDILMGGNLYSAKPEVGRYDASYGTFLKGDGKGNFESLLPNQSGLFWDGEVRDLMPIRIGNQNHLLVLRNKNSMLSFRLN